MQIIALTPAILKELHRDGVNYQVKRIFNQIPCKGMPDEAMIVPEEGNTWYICSWMEWLDIINDRLSKFHNKTVEIIGDEERLINGKLQKVYIVQFKG